MVSVFSGKLWQIRLLNNLSSYFVWFYAGMLRQKYEKTLDPLNCKYKAVFGMGAILIFLVLQCHGMWSIILLLFAAALCISALYEIVPNHIGKIGAFLSRDSFGIYLFHSPLVYITYSTLSESNPVIVVIINLVAFGLLSIALTELFRRTKLAFILGE